MSDPLTERIEKLLNRLDGDYDFQCEGGPLRNCVEWQQLRSALLSSSERAAPQEDAGDIRAIVSSYGFLLMRLAVAKDAQDAYDVCKREFDANREALERLQ